MITPSQARIGRQFLYNADGYKQFAHHEIVILCYDDQRDHRPYHVYGRESGYGGWVNAENLDLLPAEFVPKNDPLAILGITLDAFEDVGSFEHRDLLGSARAALATLGDQLATLTVQYTQWVAERAEMVAMLKDHLERMERAKHILSVDGLDWHLSAFDTRDIDNLLMRLDEPETMQ